MCITNTDLLSALPNVLLQHIATFLDPLSISATASTNKSVNQTIKALASIQIRKFYRENISKLAAETIGFEIIWNARVVKPFLITEYLKTRGGARYYGNFEDNKFSQQLILETKRLIKEFENFNSNIVTFYVQKDIPNTNPPRKITQIYIAMLFTEVKKMENVLFTTRNVFIFGDNFYKIFHGDYSKNGKLITQFGTSIKDSNSTLYQIYNIIFDTLLTTAEDKHFKALILGEDVHIEEKFYKLYARNSLNQKCSKSLENTYS